MLMLLTATDLPALLRRHSQLLQVLVHTRQVIQACWRSVQQHTKKKTTNVDRESSRDIIGAHKIRSGFLRFYRLIYHCGALSLHC